MLKEKSLISAKQAEKLIYTMTKYSDHRDEKLRQLNESQIQEFFKLNNHPWQQLVERVRSHQNPIPYVENLLGYEWHQKATNKTTLTVYHNGHPVQTLTGSGNAGIFHHHATFVKSLEERKEAIKNGSYTTILSCATHGVTAIESYVTGKANDWNNAGKQPRFAIEEISNLDVKLNDWLLIMRGFQANQAGAVWNHFDNFRNLNNKVFKHNPKNSHAATDEDMVKILNNFRSGIAEFLFILHQEFNDPVPSKIIRGIYLPEVFI